MADMRADSVERRSEKGGRALLSTPSGERLHPPGLKAADAALPGGSQGRSASFLDLLMQGDPEEDAVSTVRQKPKGATGSKSNEPESKDDRHPTQRVDIEIDTTKLGLFASQQLAPTERKAPPANNDSPVTSVQERSHSASTESKAGISQSGSVPSSKNKEGGIAGPARNSSEELNLMRRGPGRKEADKEDRVEVDEGDTSTVEVAEAAMKLLKVAEDPATKALAESKEGKLGSLGVTASGTEQVMTSTDSPPQGDPNQYNPNPQRADVEMKPEGGGPLSGNASEQPTMAAISGPHEVINGVVQVPIHGAPGPFPGGGIASDSFSFSPGTEPSAEGAGDDVSGVSGTSSRGDAASLMSVGSSQHPLSDPGGISGVLGKGGATPTSAASHGVGIASLDAGFHVEGAHSHGKTAKPEAVPQSRLSKAVEQVEAAMKEIVRGKQTRMVSLRLDPPSLGKVQVDVSLKNGTLHARLVPESSDVGNVLRERSHELHGALRKLGLAVDTVVVSVSTGEQASQFAGSSWSGSGGGRSGNSPDSRTEQESVTGSPIFQAEEDQLPLKRSEQRDYWVA